MSEPLSEEELNKKNESGITIKESLEKSLDLIIILRYIFGKLR